MYEDQGGAVPQSISVSKVASCYRIRKVDNRIKLIKKQENPLTTNAYREVTGETRSGNVDCRIPGTPHSTVQQQDTRNSQKS